MLKIAICDDCAEFLSEMEAKLRLWENSPQNTVVSCFSDGDTLIDAHTASPFDILLLDVVMPLMNGIETARKIRERDRSVKLVFLTSSPEYAVESYTVKADNYLLKPVDDRALYRCLDELLADMNKNSGSIAARSAGASHRLELRNIEYVEAQNKHTVFVLSGGKRIESIDPLHSYEGRLCLSDDFFKCHRSYIVNIDHIEQFTQKELTVLSGACIPISRSCYKQFREAYFSTVFQKAGESSD